MRRLLQSLLTVPLLACAPEDEPPAHDPDEEIARAITYAETLEQLDLAPVMTQHLEGMGLASIWADSDSAAHYRTLAPMQLETSEPFPEGSIFVKSNFDALGEPVDVLNVMVKFEPGYNPDGNDWFFAAITREGEIIDGIAGGGAKVEFCRDCHSQMGVNSDFVIGLLPEQLK
ncbi:hypothetical protein ACNOYE_21025 [Nannocystaceae bacterium ST9]